MRILDTVGALPRYIKTLFMPPRTQGENSVAIQNWRTWLDANYGPGNWIAMAGYTALVTATVKTDGSATYNTTLGYTLKSFLNTQTGEVKSFAAHHFYA